MKKYLLLLSLCFLLPALCFSRTKLRVLFLGNSYTHVNNMPQITADIATSMGDTLVYDMYAPGGYTIDNHGWDNVSRGKINAGNWDYMVLQEQSQLPALQYYFSNDVSGMCTQLRYYSPCARIMFYMTWGRKNGDMLNCPNWPPVCTYMGMDSMLQLRYIEMANSEGGQLAPVGAAWRYVRQHHPGIELYQPDESHPSVAGSYLAAVSFYTALFKKNPLAISFTNGLTPTEANILKQAVKTVVYDSLTYWDHSYTTPVADFKYNVVSGTNAIQCINYSLYADNYFWDFGDGTTSTLQHPAHSYTSDGTYQIKLTAYNCDPDDTIYTHTYTSSVTFCPFTPTITPASVTLCPGETDTFWTQAYDAYQWYDASHNPVLNADKQYIVCSGGDLLHVKATLNGCTETSQQAKAHNHNVFAIWWINAAGTLVGQDTACKGDSLTLSLFFSKPPYPPDSMIDWTLNGQFLTGYHNDSLVIRNSGTYEAIVRHPHCSSLDMGKQGTYTFIDCTTGIGSTTELDPFIISPNPGNGYFKVRIAEVANVAVYDMYGKSILNKQLNAGDNIVDLRAYPAGIYLFDTYKKGKRQSFKVIKE